MVYEKILACKLTVRGSVNVMKVFVICLAKFSKVNLSKIKIVAEAWRILIRSSQKHFPPKKRKGILKKMVLGIVVSQHLVLVKSKHSHPDAKHHLLQNTLSFLRKKVFL